MLNSFVQHRRLLTDYWLTELKRRYAGTLLGPLWAILPPAMTMATFWFVFEIGLRIPSAGDIPFFYYFAIGMLPWFLFFDTFSSSVNTVADNRHLITKMVFPSEVLPIINFMVATVPHLVLLTGMIIVLAYMGLLSMGAMPWLLYFYICSAIIALGCSWIAASVSVFSRDAAPAATLATSLLFWVTPIMWRIDMLPQSWAWAFEWNPLTYLVDGYRFALIHGQPLGLESHARFWAVAIPLWLTGSLIFKRLKHHFADVL